MEASQAEPSSLNALIADSHNVVEASVCTGSTSLDALLMEATICNASSLDALLMEATICNAPTLDESNLQTIECKSYGAMVLTDTLSLGRRMWALVDEYRLYASEDAPDLICAIASMLDCAGPESTLIDASTMSYLDNHLLAKSKTTSDKENARNSGLSIR